MNDSFKKETGLVFILGDRDLNTYKTVAKHIKEKYPESNIRIEYDLIEDKVLIYGDILTIHHFGYYLGVVNTKTHYDQQHKPVKSDTTE